MSEIRIEFNPQGFHDLLCGEEVKNYVTEQTEGIRNRADSNMGGADSEGFRSNVILGGFGGGRWVGFVSTTDEATMIAESENQALTKAVFGG